MTPRWRNAAYAAGLCLGLATALYSVAQRPDTGLPNYAIARVNQTLISKDEYAKALAARQAEKATALSAADKQRILSRLIDEELLLQYALDIGLARSIPAIRHQLVAAVLDSSVMQADAAEIGEAELRDFYAANEAFFATTGSVSVSIWYSENRQTAEEFADSLRLSTVSPSSISEDMQHRDDIPSSLIPANKLPGVLGAKLAAVALALNAGDVSVPVNIDANYYVLQVLDHRVAPAPAFDQARPLVKREFQRRNAEKLLHETLSQLREQWTVIQRDVP